MRPSVGSSDAGVPSPRAAREAPGRNGRREAVALGEAPFVHVASVVGSDAELFGAAATWAQEGVESGDLLVVGGTPAFQQAVAEEFGEADRVVFDDRVRPNGRRAPDTLATVLRFSEQAALGGSGRLRILVQVDQPDDRRAVREFACLEAASNLMPLAAPLATLCLYDERSLPADLVRTAAATHPNVLGAGGPRPSDGYAEPRGFVRGLPLPEERLQARPPTLAVDDAPALAGLRHALGAELVRAVADRDQREDLHLAISEMAANAFRHGGRPVSARVWASADRLVCTISDGGGGLDPLRGYWPAHGEDLGRGGMGLWLARKLCDHVDLTSTPEGTTVRLITTLRRPG